VTAAMTVRFSQPADTLTMNHRWHWSRRSVVTRCWRSAAMFAAVAQLGAGPSARRRPPCMVRVTFPVAVDRRRDPHNMAPTVKAIVDGLVDAGVWPDDTDTWVIVLDPRFAKVARTVDGDVVVDLIPRAGTEVWS
jgi:crossover junction endodeoxyribonuclease RusA